MKKIMEKKIYKEANKGETETTINVLYKEELIVVQTNDIKLQKHLPFSAVAGSAWTEYKSSFQLQGYHADMMM